MGIVDDLHGDGDSWMHQYSLFDEHGQIFGLWQSETGVAPVLASFERLGKGGHRRR